MSVVHEYTLVIQWSDEDQLYLAYSPELPGCITHGRTYVEAAEMGVEAMELWCDATRAAGHLLPPPLTYTPEPWPLAAIVLLAPPPPSGTPQP